MPSHSTSPTTVLASSGIFLVLTGFLATSAYNSEEHKLIADRGAAMVDARTATLPFPTRFLTRTAAEVIDQYRAAKLLAVGIATNNPSDYSDQTKRVQDNSYWSGYAQRAGNLNIHIPSAGEVATRSLVVAAWDGTGDATFSFGELVALYGDYRRTIYCDLGRCYLTNRDNPQYRFQSGTRPPGVIRFEYGDDCFGALNLDCGWRPNPLGTREYLRDIASGLWPPYGTAGNQFQNTAWPEEELDAGWWGDEMIRIANVNDWHFSQAAVAWYVGMHRLALHYAVLARDDPRHWNTALHYEASALHSLTDLFAFGHVVTSRDRTSYGIMGEKGLTGAAHFQWMENVVQVGGGNRTPGGMVELTALLPAIADRPNSRNDFMASDRGTWALRAKTEHDYHDQFNASGATVMNLKRQTFAIYGDARLRNTEGATQTIIAETVRSSLQALFDAHASGLSADEIGAVKSSYFDALLNIPVFVQSHPEHSFDGQWTRYAVAVNEITNAGVVPPGASSCVMAFVDGADAPPPARSSPCTTIEQPTGAAVLAELLHRDGALAKGDQAGLDASGNANGGYDVGDFLAWVRANNATPGSLSTLSATAAQGARP